MNGGRKKILIGAYILLAGILLLYVLFPSEAVKHYIVQRVQQDAPEVQISIDDLKLSFPPGLSMTEVVLSKNEKDLVFLDRVKVFPRWLSLLTSQRKIGFRGSAYMGRISGIALPILSRDERRWDISGDFSDLRLEQINALQEVAEVSIEGNLSGSFHVDAETSKPSSGSGNIIVSDCNVFPSTPFLNIDRLSFQKVDASFNFIGNKMDLTKNNIQGTELNGSITGRIFFESPAEQSRLDMDIIVTPNRALLSKIGDTLPFSFLSPSGSGENDFNFRLTGSLGNPNFALGSALN